ncbi:MAG TPA: alpha/beta fold hydrolase [Xanthobacteraceae bacterium]|nr:alpha/beta fold hydrolase [Xanthobacteraceae bacterium]
MRLLPVEGVRRHRSGRGPVVVMLHCLGVDHRLWDAAAAALDGSYSILRYDLPGHHESPVPGEPYTIEDVSQQLAAVLDAERIARASIVGISMGGLVAQHFAATNPARTEKLVLCDTTPRYTEAARANWARRAETARNKGVAAMTDALLDVWFTPDFVKANPPAVRYVRECFARVSGEGYAKACEALARADLRALLPDIAAPTLVVCGTEDVPDFLLAAQSFVRVIPDARLAWLAPARHASPLEQPEQFIEALGTFLRD